MTRDHSHLFPDAFYTAPLDTWAESIQRLPSGARQCLLEKVVHYKALSGMEHEFLVVYATHYPSLSKIVLGVDRSAQVPEVSPDKAQPSTLASSARYLNTFMCVKLPLFSASSEKSPDPAYDAVQVSHDGTPAPILALHGPSTQLSTIKFTSSLSRSSTASSSSSDAERPSLLHLSVLLLAIRTNFPSYDLFQYQCYFFARATCLALMDLFGGVKTELEESRMATWRGRHVSLYSAGREALQNMPSPPLYGPPALIVLARLFAGSYAVYSVLYDGNVVGSETDRRRISDEKIRQHAIPSVYRAAWYSFIRCSWCK